MILAIGHQVDPDEERVDDDIARKMGPEAPAGGRAVKIQLPLAFRLDSVFEFGLLYRFVRDTHLVGGGEEVLELRSPLFCFLAQRPAQDLGHPVVVVLLNPRSHGSLSMRADERLAGFERTVRPVPFA